MAMFKELNVYDLIGKGPVPFEEYDEYGNFVNTWMIDMADLDGDGRESIAKILQFSKAFAPYLANGIIWTIDSGCPTACTDGINIFVNVIFAWKHLEKNYAYVENKYREYKNSGNKNWKQQFSDEFNYGGKGNFNSLDKMHKFYTYRSLVFTIMHEMYHQIYEHFKQKKAKKETNNDDPNIWDLCNRAMDAEINRDIEIQFPVLKGCTAEVPGITDGIDNPKYAHAPWTTIFDDMYKNQQNQQQQNQQNQQQQGGNSSQGQQQQNGQGGQGQQNNQNQQNPQGGQQGQNGQQNQNGQNGQNGQQQGNQQNGGQQQGQNGQNQNGSQQQNGSQNGNQNGQNNQNQNGQQGQNGQQNQNGQNGQNGQNQNGSQQQNGQNGQQQGNQQGQGGQNGQSQNGQNGQNGQNQGNKQGGGQSGNQNGQQGGAQQGGQSGQGGGQQSGNQQGQGGGNQGDPNGQGGQQGGQQQGNGSGYGQIYTDGNGKYNGDPIKVQTGNTLQNGMKSKKECEEIAKKSGKEYSGQDKNKSPEDVARDRNAKAEQNGLRDVGKGTSAPMDRILDYNFELDNPVPQETWEDILINHLMNAGGGEITHKKLHKPKINQDRLDNLVPSKRVYVPEDGCVDMFYLIDASGSVSNRDLKNVFRAIFSLEEDNKSRIQASALTYFSTTVNEDRIRVWDRETDLEEKIELAKYDKHEDVGGGTEIVKCVNMVENMEDYYRLDDPHTLLVVFTDGVDNLSRAKNLSDEQKMSIVFIIFNSKEFGEKCKKELVSYGIPDTNVATMDENSPNY